MSKKRQADTIVSVFADDRLAAEINEAHEAAQRGMRDSLLHAKIAGDKLIEAKERAGHGNWLNWREKYCQFSERTAQYYMAIARQYADLTATNPQRFADMSMADAIDQIAEARRAADKEVNAGLPQNNQYADDREAKAVAEAFTKIGKRLDSLTRALKSNGTLFEAMTVLVGMKTENIVVPVGRVDLDNLIAGFVECQNHLGTYIDALRKRVELWQANDARQKSAA